MTLTHQQVRELFDYHPDGYLVWKIKPAIRTSIGDKAGSLNSQGYIQISYKAKKHKAHRLILMWHGIELGAEVYHIDGNKQNNKIENLRSVTKNQNQWNSKTRKDNRSGIKGVRWHKRDCKWTVTLRVNNKAHHFGYYDDLELAELVAHEARDLYHGKYARNN